MKKLFIGLLVIAAGTAAFFLFRKKENSTATTLNKELLLGKWTQQSVKGDTSTVIEFYEFQEKGRLLQTKSDSSRTDTMHYEWNKVSDLVLKEKKNDSTSVVFHIIQLNKDSLQLKGKDSSTILFTRAK